MATRYVKQNTNPDTKPDCDPNVPNCSLLSGDYLEESLIESLDVSLEESLIESLAESLEVYLVSTGENSSLFTD